MMLDMENSCLLGTRAVLCMRNMNKIRIHANLYNIVSIQKKFGRCEIGAISITWVLLCFKQRAHAQNKLNSIP